MTVKYCIPKVVETPTPLAKTTTVWTDAALLSLLRRLVMPVREMGR